MFKLAQSKKYQQDNSRNVLYNWIEFILSRCFLKNYRIHLPFDIALHPRDLNLHLYPCENLKSHKFPVENFFPVLRHNFFISTITLLTIFMHIFGVNNTVAMLHCWTHITHRKLSLWFTSNCKFIHGHRRSF